MINEDKKSRGQEGKQISSLHTLAPCGRGQGEGLYGLPRPHFVRPRNDETTCHPELVSGSCNHEALKQAPTSILPDIKTAKKESRVDFSLPEMTGLPRSLRSLAMTKAFTLAEVFLSHFVGRRKIAFTLAEVLITLGIIGIVAAMTMPALIENHNKKVVETRLQKFYSSMNQAIQIAEIGFSFLEI